MNRQVVIAGGGLAGLSLAAGLRLRGVPVTVHEAGAYPRHRVCGEFISGTSDETLEALGIAGVLENAVRQRTVRWASKGKNLLETGLTEPARGISRWRLDQRLCHRARELGAEILERSRVRKESREGLAWAAGRAPAKDSGWLGLKCHFEGLALEADLEMHLGDDGYAGLARIEDGRVNVCGLFRIRRDLKAQGPGLLLAYLRQSGNAALAERLAAAQADRGSFLGVAGFRLGRQPEEAGLFTLGDAERMIPPFTGNGMSMAFQSAECALEPLQEWSAGLREWEATLRLLQSRLQKRFQRRMAAASALHPLLLAPVGRRSIEALARGGLLPFSTLLSLVR